MEVQQKFTVVKKSDGAGFMAFFSDDDAQINQMSDWSLAYGAGPAEMITNLGVGDFVKVNFSFQILNCTSEDLAPWKKDSDISPLTNFSLDGFFLEYSGKIAISAGEVGQSDGLDSVSISASGSTVSASFRWVLSSNHKSRSVVTFPVKAAFAISTGGHSYTVDFPGSNITVNVK